MVAPIKRELPDQASLVAEETTHGGAGVTSVSEKYSLPPFETLVTSHWSPEMPAPSPLNSVERSSTAIGTGVSPSAASIGVPSTIAPGETAAVRLPGIHQLFQTTSGQPVLASGTGNSPPPSTVDDDELHYTWCENELLGVIPGTFHGRHHPQHQLVQFFDDSVVVPHDLPPPPPYPGPPGHGGKRPPCLTYGAGLSYTVGDYGNFQTVLSSARR